MDAVISRCMDNYMDIEGTRLWMVEGRAKQELLSRTMQGAIVESEAGSQSDA
jgi:hypothetical protein